VHALAGVGVFAEQDPEDSVNPAKHERHTESPPDIAQDRQFEKAEHTEPLCSHAFTPEENVYEANPA